VESFGWRKEAEEHEAEEVFVMSPVPTPKSHYRQSLQWHSATLGVDYVTRLC